MSLRYRVIPSILNGVSKQPPLLRAADQNEVENNTWSTMARGLGKRPPSEHVAFLQGAVGTNAFVHYINRDTTERYCVVIEGGAIRVFDILTGQSKPVAAPHGYGYLAGGSNFRAVTVADYTFIVNADRVCAMGAPDVDLVPDPVDYVWPNATSVGSTVVNKGSQQSVKGTTIQYAPSLPANSYGGELASMEKLPETSANGVRYKIIGSAESAFVSYYVVRNGAVWDETVGPGQTNAIDSTTMPHALVREADGSFTFAPFSWAPRRVGDAGTNPPPTFIGRSISDVFFYQNRLGLLVDENMVFSCAGDFGNFWRNTVIDYVASDVIDVAAATANVALLKYALPFNDGIMAFADQVQFSVTNGEEGLTPESLAISPVTHYEINTKVRPVSLGTEVYFCGEQGGSTAVWEYTRMAQGENLLAAEITAHVPGYLPPNVTHLIAAANSKALFALTGSTDVFVYQFYWDGNEKILSAWRRWQFPYPVIGGDYMGGSLYLVTSRPDGVCLERVNLDDEAKPSTQNLQVFLDARVGLSGVYDPVNDRTLFTFPYNPRQPYVQLVRPKTHPSRPGALIDPSQYSWDGPRFLWVPGNEASATAGEKYEQRITFSRQFPVDYQGRPVGTGRLQLRTFTVSYADTAFFRTEVAPYGAALAADVEEVVPALLSNYTGKTVGNADLILNAPVSHTGSYSFQVYGDAALAEISITNDTHCAATFMAAEWEGFYVNRANL